MAERWYLDEVTAHADAALPPHVAGLVNWYLSAHGDESLLEPLVAEVLALSPRPTSVPRDVGPAGRVVEQVALVALREADDALGRDGVRVSPWPDADGTRGAYLATLARSVVTRLADRALLPPLVGFRVSVVEDVTERDVETGNEED